MTTTSRDAHMRVSAALRKVVLVTLVSLISCQCGPNSHSEGESTVAVELGRYGLTAEQAALPVLVVGERVVRLDCSVD